MAPIGSLTLAPPRLTANNGHKQIIVIDGRTASAASTGLGALDGAPSSTAYIDGRPDTANVGSNSAAPRVVAITHVNFLFVATCYDLLMLCFLGMWVMGRND